MENKNMSLFNGFCTYLKKKVGLPLDVITSHKVKFKIYFLLEFYSLIYYSIEVAVFTF